MQVSHSHIPHLIKLYEPSVLKQWLGAIALTSSSFSQHLRQKKYMFLHINNLVQAVKTGEKLGG